MKIELRGTLVLTGIVAASILLSGCGKKEMISVNGEKVSRDEFYSRLEQVPVQTNTGTRLAGDHVVRKLIDEILILQYAKQKGVAPTDQQVTARIDRVRKQEGVDLAAMLKQSGMSMDDYKKQQAVEQAFVNVISKNITISDAELQKAYQLALKDPKSGLKRPAQVIISLIAVGKAGLPLVQKRLNSGENFNSVAKELSEDPTGKKSAGQLGVWLSAGMPRVPPIIIKTAFATGQAKFSDPIFLDGKYYIIHVDRKRDAKVTSYDEIKALIQERMAIAQGMRRGEFKKDMKDFIIKSKIDIRSSNYKEIAKQIKETAGTEQGNASTAAPAKQ